MNSFGANGLQVQKEPNLTLPTLTNDIWSDSTKSIFWYVIYFTQKKLHAKKEEKLLKRFWDIPLPPPPPPSILTDGRTDGRTDGGRCNISRPRAYGAAGDKNYSKFWSKVGVGSNIAQNRLFSPLEVICDHYISQFMSKVDQKCSESLLRIACLANRKSYIYTLPQNK